ncbi:MAG: hypothetical protein LBD27_08395 [Tannerella sp.]|nr:hypothetical protein [Tannerella sp.]
MKRVLLSFMAVLCATAWAAQTWTEGSTADSSYLINRVTDLGGEDISSIDIHADGTLWTRVPNTGTPWTTESGYFFAGWTPVGVTLKLPAGIVSQRAAGRYQIPSGSDFVFTLTLPAPDRFRPCELTT